MKLGHPVRWIEDRREHLIASVHARDILRSDRLSRAQTARILGIEGEVYIDAGAYSLWPTGSLHGSQHGRAQPDRPLPHPASERATRYTVATNKAPMGPYRGVGRARRMLRDRAADRRSRARAGREPFELRAANIVTAGEMPYRPSPA